MKTIAVVLSSLVARAAFAEPDVPAPSSAPPLAEVAHATAEQGSKGLSFSVPSGGGPTFGFAYMVASDASIRVDVGLAVQSEPGMGERANTAGFSIETGYRMYKPIVGRLTSFLQPSVYLAKTPGVDFGNALTAAITAGFGIEYWITPQWSVSGTTGVALQAKSDMTSSFNVISLTTGTSALSASFYWK
jgi:hypothetical protein